jgi:hypothetical protein
MKFSYPLLAGLLGALMLVLPGSAAQKKVVGWIEKVRIYPGGLTIRAKLDSGAEYSSLHATNLSEFVRDGRRWVRFDVDNQAGGQVTIERPLLREAIIKRHFHKAQKRPVVKIGVCLGRIYKETEVNLVDRSGFNYRMLIGRKFMAGAVIIDPAVQYSIEPECSGPANLE